MEHHINNLFFFEKENVVTITKEKVASRFLAEIYDIKEVGRNNIFLDGRCNNYEDNNIECYTSFDSLVNDHSQKKDVYLFYRNPIKRLYSGIVQFILSGFRYDNIFLKYELNKLFDKYSINTYEFLYYINTSNFKEVMSNPSHVDLFRDLIRDCIDWQIKLKPIQDVHIDNYVYLMYELSFKLNHHNIFYVNIDSSKNNIESIYSKYDNLFTVTNNANR